MKDPGCKDMKAPQGYVLDTSSFLYSLICAQHTLVRFSSCLSTRGEVNVKRVRITVHAFCSWVIRDFLFLYWVIYKILSLCVEDKEIYTYMANLPSLICQHRDMQHAPNGMKGTNRYSIDLNWTGYSSSLFTFIQRGRKFMRAFINSCFIRQRWTLSVTKIDPIYVSVCVCVCVCVCVQIILLCLTSYCVI